MPTLSNIEAMPNAQTGARSAGKRGDARKANLGKSAKQHFAHYLTRPLLRLSPLAFGAAIIATIALAFSNRNEGYLTAESGVGYWLGISGALIMLTLILYPLRKRYKFLHGIGKVANWFRLHMVLGILGPALVVLHTNFKLGSLNSQLALFTMLIVVASGIIGRYLYSKVHKGLYGSQAQLREVVDDLSVLKDGLGASFSGLESVAKELARYVPDELRPPSFAKGITSALFSGARTRASRRRILGLARHYLDRAPHLQDLSRRQRRHQLRDIDQQLGLYFTVVKKAERLAFFERIFGLWHHLHVPLFVLLTLTVVLHVIAVHRY